VTVIDFGQTDDGVFYLVMELVNGKTLDQVVEAERAFRPERVVRIGAQVCDALEVAHALRIVHRDLKPSNIMLLASGRDLIKVLDFGLAKSVATDQTPTTMTGAGALLGTPAFMPPEIALGQPCDGRADLYSLGVVLYLLGSGGLPFQAGSAAELIAMHATEPAPPMPGVPPALAQVIDRMLAKDPADRYQTAAAAREALEAAIAPGATRPSPGPFPADAPGPPDADSTRDLATTLALPAPPAPALDARPEHPRRRRAAIAVGALAALGGAAIVTAALRWRSTDEHPAAAPPLAAPPSASVPAPPSPPPAAPVDPPRAAAPPDPAPSALHAPEPLPARPAGKPPRIRREPARRPPTRPEPAKPPAPPASQGAGQGSGQGSGSNLPF